MRIAVCALGLLLSATSHAWSQDSGVVRHQPAEPTSSASADEQILAGLAKAKKDGEGLVIIGGSFEGKGCDGVVVTVARRVGLKLERVAIVSASKYLGKVRNFAPKGLAADDWMVLSVTCAMLRGGHIFEGPYAEFSVRAGEVLDVGVLNVNYTPDEFFKTMFTGSATIRLSVEATPEFRLEELRRRIPRVMGLAKKQPMVRIGLAEQKVKFKKSDNIPVEREN